MKITIIPTPALLDLCRAWIFVEETDRPTRPPAIEIPMGIHPKVYENRVRRRQEIWNQYAALTDQWHYWEKRLARNYPFDFNVEPPPTDSPTLEKKTIDFVIEKEVAAIKMAADYLESGALRPSRPRKGDNE